MSQVTNIILCILPINNKKKIRRLNEINNWLKTNGHFPIKELKSEHIGGEKNMEADIFVGAFNYLSLSEFIMFLKVQNWERATDLFVKTEEADRFTKIKIDGYNREGETE